MRRLIVFAMLVGCGGKPAPKEPKIDVGQVCTSLCTRLTGCAMEDAQANLSPEEIRKLELEQKLAAHTEECRTECTSKGMSARQGGVVSSCLEQNASCAPLLDCLDKAAPKSQGAVGSNDGR